MRQLTLDLEVNKVCSYELDMNDCEGVNMTFKLSLIQILRTFPLGRMRMSLKYLLSHENFNFWQKTEQQQQQKAQQIKLLRNLENVFLKWHLHFRHGILPQGGAVNTGTNGWPQTCLPRDFKSCDSQPAFCPQQNTASCNASDPKDSHN